MTCIVGIADSGNVYLGADSAGVSGFNTTIRTDVKVFRNGPYVMGFTSSFRMGQLLQYTLKAPVPEDLDDSELHGFMCTVFVDEVRDCLKAGGFAEDDKGQESGGTFLVGVQGHLYEVASDYQVGEREEGYEAIGCGEAYALGSLYSTSGNDAYTPVARITLALEAADRYSNGVQGPFHYATLETWSS